MREREREWVRGWRGKRNNTERPRRCERGIDRYVKTGWTNVIVIITDCNVMEHTCKCMCTISRDFSVLFGGLREREKTLWKKKIREEKKYFKPLSQFAPEILVFHWLLVILSQSCWTNYTPGLFDLFIEGRLLTTSRQLLSHMHTLSSQTRPLHKYLN